MNAEDAIYLGQQAIITTLIVAAPLLIVGMVVGLLIGLLQALTQVQDQTIAFVPKLVATVLVLMLCLPWLLQRMLEYSTAVIGNVPQTIGGG